MQRNTADPQGSIKMDVNGTLQVNTNFCVEAPKGQRSP